MKSYTSLSITLLFMLLFSLSATGQQADQFRGRLKKQKPSFTQTIIKDKFNKAMPSESTTTITPEHRTCETMEAEAQLRAKYPQMRSLAEEESIFQEKIQEYRSQLVFRSGVEEVISIPVVVHVVHNGEAVGQGANITQAQIQSQINVLNEDYRRTGGGANNHPAGADVEIQFVLAKEDPQGNPLAEPGIHRVHGGRASWEREPIQQILKPQTQWDPNRYMNMWTVQFGGESSSLLGYAQFPSLSGLQGFEQNEGPAKTDGVVIRYQSFGNTGNVEAPYDGGRTATHEVGHWLGLRHIWGDGDCSADDFCADTPRASQPNYNCVQIQTCTGTERDMVENYMDYTPDNCMNIFTNDQKARIRTVLMNSPRRKELLTSMESTGSGNHPNAPVASFAVDKSGTCAGESIHFSDQSSNNPTAWEWNFYDEAGTLLGTFNNSTLDITFNTPGLYSVELKTSNGSGQDSYYEENFITILSDQRYTELTEDLENQNTALKDWVLFNPDADRTFTLSEVSAYDYGSASVVFDNYSVDDDPSGKIDALVSPAFDLSFAINPYFYFEHAYATFNTTYSDTLVMFYSLDCGETFVPFWFKGGEELATALPSEDSFVPTSEEWAWNQVSLAGLIGQPSVHILIANLSGWGNNLYLDNISYFDAFSLTEAAPEPDFYVARTTICEGDLLQFQDYSSNYPTEWFWQFEGGSPSSSSNQHPFVTYETPGLYDVSFQSANFLGGGGFTIPNMIEVIPLPEVTLSADVDQLCAGDAVTLTAGGASTYQWFDQRSGTLIYEGASFTATLYQSVTFIVVGANELGCENAAVFQVEVNPTPEKPVISFDGQLLTATPGYTYQWFLEDTPIPAAQGGSQQNFQPSESGNYIVAVVTAQGCFAISDPMSVSITGTNENLTDLSHNLLLFPNPTTGQINLEMDNDVFGQFKVRVINSVGQTVRSFTWEKNTQRLQEAIDLTAMATGVYTVTITNDTYRALKKVVKH
ncbi:MAG: PKD domain-containing protein [Saprospiraceae bacterium]